MPYTKPSVLPAWAESGDKVQPTNAEIQTGWPLSSTPPARQRFNWILNYLANAVRYFSRRGLSDYDAAETYMTGDRIIGDDGQTYRSVQDNNTAHTPSTSSTWWELWGPSALKIQQAAYMSAVAGGTVDAITAAFTPAIAALPAAPGTLSVFVRATGANTSTTPTFKADGTAVKTIVKGNNVPLLAGDIAGAGHWLELQYDATLDKWVLLNPSSGVTTRGKQRFVSNGSFTVPSGISTIWISGCGGGGGGGGSGGVSGVTSGFSASGGGGGGGAGQYQTRVPYAVTPGQVLTITIGAGGVNGLAGAAGSNGGVGGNGAATTVAGTGVSVSLSGGNGGGGGYGISAINDAGGGGGVGGGNGASDGSSGLAVAGYSYDFGGMGGAGGSSNFGIGGGTRGTGGIGFSASGFGAGGGGAGGVVSASSSVGHAGGYSSNGFVEIEW